MSLWDQQDSWPPPMVSHAALEKASRRLVIDLAGASIKIQVSKLYPYNAISIATIQTVKLDCYLLLWVIKIWDFSFSRDWADTIVIMGLIRGSCYQTRVKFLIILSVQPLLASSSSVGSCTSPLLMLFLSCLRCSSRCVSIWTLHFLFQ